MIYEVKCKHCNTNLRINGSYAMDSLKRKHLKEVHPEAFKIYYQIYDQIKKLEKEIEILTKKQNSDNYEIVENEI